MNPTTRWVFTLAAGFVATTASAQAPRPEGPLTHTPRPTSAAISAEDLRTHVYTLAADSMLGREAGTRGNVMGTDYIAAQAQRIGLRPAGENGTFFQTVPLVELGLTPGAVLRAGGQALAVGTDFIAVPNYGGFLLAGETFSANDVPVVYGGRVGDPASMISPEQAAGKFVIFDAPLGPNGRPTFGFWSGGRTYERYADAVGLAFATLDVTNEGIRDFLGGERMELEHAAEPDSRRFPPAVIVSQAAAARLMGKPLSGLRVGEAGGTVSGSYTFSSRPVAFPARNVIAVLPGSDPALRGEYVAIGAHNDHVGTTDAAVDHDSLLVFNRLLRPQGADQEPEAMTAELQAAFQQALAARRAAGPARLDSIYNGADDDASGSASMLEIAQYLAANPPRRSVLFVWHTAEELGLYGSEYFTDHPTVPRDSIVTQLNIDMLGRGGTEDDVKNGGPSYLELVGSRRLSTQLGDLLEEVNRTGNFGLQFDYSMDAPGHPQQIYCRSDHANYARYGIPVTFFTTGGHSDYHMLTDEPQYIEYDKLANVSRYIAAVTEAIGNRTERLVVDKPVLGPDAPCEQ